MKLKIFILALIVLVFGSVQAQDTVRYGDSNYYSVPYDSTIEINYFGSFPLSLDGWNFVEYCSSEPLQVYGIAILSNNKPHYLQMPGLTGGRIWFDTTAANVDLYAMLLIKEGGHYYHVDSARWSPRSPNRYFKFGQNLFTYHGRGFDTVVPVYEFYFSTPRVVVDTFYVGIFSTFANYDWLGNRVSYINGQYADTLGLVYGDTLEDLGGHLIKEWPVFFLEVGSGGNALLRELIHIYKREVRHGGVMEIIDTAEYNTLRWRTFLGGAFPIIVPPDTDSFECPRVEDFRLAGQVEGHPKFRWDAQNGQGPFQIAYGPADQPVDSHRVASALRQPYVLPDGGLDSTVLYVARCRGRCHHTCPLHDTIFWSEWSDPVEFWTGSRRPGSEGMASPNGAAAFTLSPNPAKGRVTVTVGGAVSAPCAVVLRDEQGRELLRQRLEINGGGAATELSTQGLPAGVYLVSLESHQGSSTQKLVVEGN